MQHGAGKVLFPARGCRHPPCRGTKCRAPRLRENGRQSYRFHITKHPDSPDWSNVIPAAGTPSLASLPVSQDTSSSHVECFRTTAAHHLRRFLTWLQSNKTSRSISRSACTISAEPSIGWPPQRLSCMLACRAPRRACRCSSLPVRPTSNGTSLSQMQPPFHPLYRLRAEINAALSSGCAVKGTPSNSTNLTSQEVDHFMVFIFAATTRTQIFQYNTTLL